MMAGVHAASERETYILHDSRAHVTVHVTHELIGHKQHSIAFR